MSECFKDAVEVALHSKLDLLSTNYQFAVSLRLDDNELLNNTNCEDMPVPVSLEKLKKLAGVISKGNNVLDPTDRSTHLIKLRKLWQISGEEMLKECGFTAQVEKYSDTLPELTNKMLRLMGLDPLVFKMKSTLQHVIICGTGSSAKFSFHENKGGFMKMILQIPVEGGHEGGRIKVELNDQIRLFNVCDGSDRYCHLTTFYSDCDHTLEEVKFGCRLAMIFDLDLETTPFPYSLSPSADLHTFLAVNDVQETLSQWTSSENNHPVMLVLLLEHRYASSELDFCRLKGKDHLLVRLLLSVGTVDMYLAYLRKSTCESPNATVSEEEDGNTGSVKTGEENSETDRLVANCLCCVERSCKCLRHETQTVSDDVQPEIGVDVEITSLTCLDGQIIECTPVNIDIDTDVIPFNHSLYTLDPELPLVDSDFLEMDGDYFDPSNLRYVFNSRAVLVISPKKSLELILNCNFTVALDRLEANPNIRACNEVISFCECFPDKVWLDAIDREERTRRLVSMCIQTNAKYNGLRLLHLLSFNFPGQPVRYEGLRNKAIAIEVARLIKFIGLTTSAWDFLNDLLSEHRAGEQLENFAHLVMGLYDVGLKDIARDIGNRCVTFLYSQSKNLMPSLSVSTLVTCTAMVFRMYEENRDSGWLYSVSDGLKLLPLHTLFFVIDGIQTTCRSHLDNNQECQKMQQGLHRKLLSYFIPEALAAEIMFFYLKLDDAILLKRFTQELVYKSNMNAIKMIVASPEVWNQALTTPDGKWALNWLVSTRVNHLEEMRLPVFSWIQGNAVFDEAPLLRNFFHSSAARETFHGFTSQQEAETWCEEYFGPDQLEDGYSAKTEIRGEGAKFECVVTKTRDLHWHHVSLYHESRTELLALRDRRLRRLPVEEGGSKVNFITTSQKNSISSGTSSCLALPATKRFRCSDIDRK